MSPPPFFFQRTITLADVEGGGRRLVVAICFARSFRRSYLNFLAFDIGEIVPGFFLPFSRNFMTVSFNFSLLLFRYLYPVRIFISVLYWICLGRLHVRPVKNATCGTLFFLQLSCLFLENVTYFSSNTSGNTLAGY